MNRAVSITDFVFGDLDSDSFSAAKLIRLQSGSEKNDAAVRNRFGHYLQYFTAAKLGDWESTPLGVIGLCILLDVFPRQMFRGTRRQYAYDSEAQRVIVSALENGIYDQIKNPVLKCILLGPLRNAEDINLQRTGYNLYLRILEEYATHPNIGWVRSNGHMFEKSFKAIETFGRFPDRNELLGRNSKTEEVRALYDGSIMNSNFECKRSDRMRIANWTEVSRPNLESSNTNWGK